MPPTFLSLCIALFRLHILNGCFTAATPETGFHLPPPATESNVNGFIYFDGGTAVHFRLSSFQVSCKHPPNHVEAFGSIAYTYSRNDIFIIKAL